MNMILRLPLIIALSVVTIAAAETPANKPPHEQIDETARFIFYSVLEGLYEDGLSTEDVAQILMKKEKQAYFHFIYSCPICNATIWALEAYRERPKQFYGLKLGGSTFGPGLSDAQHKQLYSDDSQERLTAINALVQTWMDRRMKNMQLSKKDRANLLESLEKKRKEGMDALESFRRKAHGPSFGVAEAAPAYTDLQECAVCNAAVGKPMKLPDAK